MLHVCSYIDIFCKEFSITIEDDKSKHDSVIQSGQQIFSGATIESHEVIQQGEQSMCYTVTVFRTLQISCILLRLF